MMKPPPGDGPDPGSQQPPPPPPSDRPGAGGPAYPRQELSEQQVAPGHSRAPLAIGALAVVVAVVVGVAVWLLLDDGQEDSRAAYCTALSDVTNGGQLMSALESADQETVAGFEEVARLAPDAVAGDWETLTSLARDPGALTEESAVSAALDAWSALRSIARDAEEKCNLSLDIPLN